MSALLFAPLLHVEVIHRRDDAYRRLGHAVIYSHAHGFDHVEPQLLAEALLWREADRARWPSNEQAALTREDQGARACPA